MRRRDGDESSLARKSTGPVAVFNRQEGKVVPGSRARCAWRRTLPALKELRGEALACLLFLQQQPDV